MADVVWHVADGRLTHDELAEPLMSDYMEAPYPPYYWQVQNGRLVTTGLAEPITADYIEKPYPSYYWYVEDGRLKTSLLAEPILDGAFLNCSNLQYVCIPESVKKIGKEAFAGTALKHVRIAKDCAYSPTSFPDGCEISFYGDEIVPDGYYTSAEIDAKFAELEARISTELKGGETDEG